MQKPPSSHRVDPLSTGIGSMEWQIRNGRIELSKEARIVLGLPASKEFCTYGEFLALVAPSDHKAFNSATRNAIMKSGVFNIEHRITAFGKDRLIQTSGRVLRDEDGAPASVSCTVQDISVKNEVGHLLKLSDHIFEHSNESIVITNAAGDIQRVNQAFCRASGYEAEDIIGHPARLLSQGLHEDAHYQAIMAALEERSLWQGEILNRAKDGQIYATWARVTVLRDNANRILNFVTISTDVSKRDVGLERIENMNEDALTGLPNRILVLDRLKQLIINAKASHAVSVLLLNLDRFKQVNDAHGHAVGDAVLKEISQRIRTSVADVDTVARMNGDEFAVVVAENTIESHADSIAARIAARVSAPIQVESKSMEIGTSIGISVYPSDAQTAEDLIQQATLAMHQAKSAGQGGIRQFTPDMNVHIMRRAQLESSLRKAITHNELSLVYQPQVHAATERIVGVEALLRWHHPEYGWVTPAEFIPIAEDSGAILDLGRWALREACLQLKAWHDRGYTHLSMGVNVSAIQLRSQAFETTLRDTLAKTGIDPHFLELEITESAVMNDKEGANAAMRRLKESGVRISIDDFGTGYSSLSYLKTFSIDKLKIDKSFIDDAATKEEDAAIVNAIVMMAKSLKLKTICEGVETAEQLRFLRSIGCDEIQGYYFSKPLPAAEVELLIDAGSTGGQEKGLSEVRKLRL